MDTDTRICVATKADGNSCKVSGGLSPSGFCFWHDPERKAQAQAARAKGGKSTGEKRRKVLPPEAVPELRTAADAKELAAKVSTWVLTGAVEKGIGSLVLAAIKTFLLADDRVALEEEAVHLREQLAALQKGR